MLNVAEKQSSFFFLPVSSCIQLHIAQYKCVVVAFVGCFSLGLS